MSNPGSWDLAAQCCAGHRCEEAIPLLEDALRSRPMDAELCYQLGSCYTGACRNHRLVSPPLAVAYFERALRIVGTRAAEAVRLRYQEALGAAFRADGQLTKSKEILEAVARGWAANGGREESARTEYNLGNLCCDLAEAGEPDHWTSAIAHYQKSLQLRREYADPLRFAATMQNLGTAYRECPVGEASERIRCAIRCYCSAFRVYARASRTEKLAGVHNNLGNAYLELCSHREQPCRNVRRALRHFDAALRRHSKQVRPCEYAVTQFNRAQGYLMLTECDAGDAVYTAVRCFEEALEGFRQCGDSGHAKLVERLLQGLGGMGV